MEWLLTLRACTLVDPYQGPATDDRPYFFHFFKWSTLPEVLALRGRGGTPLLDAGYLMLVAIHFGFTAVILAALILYGLAATVFPEKEG